MALIVLDPRDLKTGLSNSDIEEMRIPMGAITVKAQRGQAVEIADQVAKNLVRFNPEMYRAATDEEAAAFGAAKQAKQDAWIEQQAKKLGMTPDDFRAKLAARAKAPAAAPAPTVGPIAPAAAPSAPQSAKP